MSLSSHSSNHSTWRAVPSTDPTKSTSMWPSLMAAQLGELPASWMVTVLSRVGGLGMVRLVHLPTGSRFTFASPGWTRSTTATT